MSSSPWLAPALTALFSMAVLCLSWGVRQMIKLTTSVALLATQVEDVRANGSDRLAEILRQAQRNERVSYGVAVVALVGWAMRGWIAPRRPGPRWSVR